MNGHVSIVTSVWNFLNRLAFSEDCRKECIMSSGESQMLVVAKVWWESAFSEDYSQSLRRICCTGRSSAPVGSRRH